MESTTPILDRDISNCYTNFSKMLFHSTQHFEQSHKYGDRGQEYLQLLQIGFHKFGLDAVN